MIGRGDLTLHLRKRPDVAGTAFCHLVVDDAQRWFDRLVANGATFRRRLETSPYGMRDFAMIDCRGDLTGIGEPSS